MIARRRAVMHLKNYKKVEQAMQDTAREMERVKAEIAAASDPRVNKYGGTGGGYHLLNEVESRADRRERLAARYHELDRNQKQMALYLRCVDRALSILSEQERETPGEVKKVFEKCRRQRAPTFSRENAKINRRG